MDLNRIDYKDMPKLMHLNLFFHEEDERGRRALPNYAYLQPSIPIYDFDEREYVWIPRSPLPEWSPNA